jgi:hypothetical protein
MPAIPQIFIKEFMKSERLVPKPGGSNGTRPVDLKVFQQVIRETLENKAVLQQIVNAAVKQGQFQVK